APRARPAQAGGGPRRPGPPQGPEGPPPAATRGAAGRRCAVGRTAAPPAGAVPAPVCCREPPAVPAPPLPAVLPAHPPLAGARRIFHFEDRRSIGRAVPGRRRAPDAIARRGTAHSAPGRD